MWPEMFDPSQTRLVKVVEKTTTVTYYEAVEDRATLLDSYSYPSIRRYHSYYVPFYLHRSYRRLSQPSRRPLPTPVSVRRYTNK